MLWINMSITPFIDLPWWPSQAQWHVHWSYGTSIYVSTCMGDHQGTLGAVNLGPFISVDLNLWPTVFVKWIKLPLVTLSDSAIRNYLPHTASAPLQWISNATARLVITESNQVIWFTSDSTSELLPVRRIFLCFSHWTKMNKKNKVLDNRTYTMQYNSIYLRPDGVLDADNSDARQVRHNCIFIFPIGFAEYHLIISTGCSWQKGNKHSNTAIRSPVSIWTAYSLLIRRNSNSTLTSLKTDLNEDGELVWLALSRGIYFLKAKKKTSKTLV